MVGAQEESDGGRIRAADPAMLRRIGGWWGQTSDRFAAIWATTLTDCSWPESCPRQARQFRNGAGGWLEEALAAASTTARIC